MANVLQVSQNDDGEALREIVSLIVDDSWERFGRIFPNRNIDPDPPNCWLDWLSEDGVTLLEDPIIITPDQARWLLRDFYHRPKLEWNQIKG
jgi:hypothetical protein